MSSSLAVLLELASSLKLRWGRQGGNRRGTDLFDLVFRAVREIDDSESPPEYSDDAYLIQQVGAGRRDAAEDLYDRYSDRIFRYIRRRVGHRLEDAEDLTLETFLSAIELAPTFSGQSTAFVWLCGIARLRLIDYHRRNSSGRRIPVELQISIDVVDDAVAKSAPLEKVLDKIMAAQLIDAALSRLSVHEKEVLLLRYAEGMSVQEISQVMRRSERAVEALLLRAKAKPRKVLLNLASGEEGRS